MDRGISYMVPDLPVKEIITYFAEVGIEIAPAEILKPALASTQRIYDSILELFVSTVPPNADESLQTIRQVQRMGLFLERIGMPGFTVRDLVPDSKRLISLLSAIINFGMFRDNKRHVYERVGQIADANYTMRKMYETKIEELRGQISEVSDELSHNLGAAAAHNADIASLEEELKRLYKHQRDKAGEVALLKNEKAELGDRLSAAQLLEHNLKQETACLRAQVVSDPTRLMELVGEMRMLVDKERESIRQTEEAISAGNTRLARANRCGETLKAASELSGAIGTTVKKIEELEQECVAAESRLRAWDSRINALKIRVSHVDRQISHLQSKIFNLQTKDKRSSEEISEKIANIRIKYDSVSAERSKMAQMVQENNKRVQDLMYLSAKAAGEHERECSEIISLLTQLNGQVDSYFSELSNCIE